MSNVSKNDVDKKCRKCCKVCIIPCRGCHMGRCDQCKYGWMSITSKLIVRYTREELKEFKDTCEYAKLAYEQVSN